MKFELKNSEILINDFKKSIEELLPKNKKIIVLTDINVNKLYGSSFKDFPIIEIGIGETIKTFETVEYITERLIELEADRHSFLLGVGGGIVCDITGFVASIFMRGIKFGFVSTTLLSQVDASIGGKNGVNFSNYKNIIGNFNQPEFVICDTNMLKTLPSKEIKCGMGEIIKHALIADAKMFDFLNSENKKILALDNEILPDLILENIKIKAKIVEKDEKEQAERKKLNFGHTLAHAIEKHSDISHGEAVAIGIVFAAKISLAKGYISDKDFELITDTISKFDLPTKLKTEKYKILDAFKKDKKRKGDKISFILLEKIGKAKIEDLSLKELEKYLNDLC